MPENNITELTAHTANKITATLCLTDVNLGACLVLRCNIYILINYGQSTEDRKTCPTF